MVCFWGLANLMVLFTFTQVFPWLPWQRNFTPIFSGCHGNNISENMGYNSASVRAIGAIFAFIGRFWGLGYRVVSTKFYL